MKETLCQCQTTQNANDRATAVTVEIPDDLLGQLREAAAVAGTDYQSLLLCYARQGLINSGAQLKRGQFVEHVKEVLEKHGVQTNVIEEIFSKFLY
jgi:hypothetical protein